MKNLTKYSLWAGALLLIPMCANAEITVKETTSPEFIYNAGYSNEISRLIQVKTKNPATPIPVAEKGDKARNFKWYLWEFIDPAVDRPNSFADHNIKFHNSIDDL